MQRSHRAAAAALPFFVAALAVVLATEIRLWSGSWLADDPSVMFLAAVALTSWRYGVKPGVFGVVLSSLAQAHFFLGESVFWVETPQQAVSVVVWAAEGVLVCLLFGALQAAKARALAVADVLATNHEELLHKEARANAANRAKSEFLANMSHELRTPMTAILGFGDLLLEPDLTETERGVHVDVIQRNARHLLGLIDGILDLSKIEADKMEIERIPCSPSDIVEDVASLLRAPALRKNLPLRVVYATAVPPVISCDPTRLRQILVNLVSNAVKFTTHGEVTVTARRVDAAGGPPRLAFEVADTGLGIAEEDREHVFAPFAQADSSTTRRFGGTGLGLTISSKLAHALGGSLTLASTLGAGSTFTLTVPTGPLAGEAVGRGRRRARP